MLTHRRKVPGTTLGSKAKVEQTNKCCTDSAKAHLQTVLKLKYTTTLILDETWALHCS